MFIKTGFDTIDDTIGGFFRSGLTVICGEPSVGKSTFLQTIVLQWILDFEPRLNTVLVSQTSALSTGAGLLVRQTGLDYQDIVIKGHIYRADWSKLVSEAGKLSESPLYIISGVESFDDFRSRANSIADKTNALLIDSLELFEEARLRECLHFMKGIALKRNIPVIATSSIPANSDEFKKILRYSDMVLELKCENRESSSADISESISQSDSTSRSNKVLKVLKNRYGPSGITIARLQPVLPASLHGFLQSA